MMTPKLIVCLREGYTRQIFWRDLAAGITVGIVAIPLAMAFAIASGVTPDRGLFTAIVAGFLISALGGSRVQIGGPTGAFVVIVYAIVQQHGYDGLAIATLMAGVLVFLMGLFRLGAAIKFIPYPVITGFTSGIALIIFSSQIREFFGLHIASVPAEFIGKWHTYLAHADTWSPITTLLAFLSLAAMVLMRRLAPRFPAALVVVVVTAGIVYFLHLPVETIGSRFGGIPSTLPHPALPAFTWAQLPALFPSAITIALLCAIESLLSAVVADGMTGFNHKSNTELMAQGIANIASVLFGGIPATGALARTATNVKSGARTPVSGMVHALTILVCLWALAPLASLIPLSALAAILVIVSWNMSEAPHVIRMFRAPRQDLAVLLLTFFLTVLVDLTTGVLVGVVVATLLFMKDMSLATTLERDEEYTRATLGEVPDEAEIYELSGPFFFGAADRLKSVLGRIKRRPKLFILRLRKVPVIDASGLQALRQFIDDLKRGGASVVLCEMNPQVRRAVIGIKLHEALAPGGLCTATIEEAVAYARQMLVKNS